MIREIDGDYISRVAAIAQTVTARSSDSERSAAESICAEFVVDLRDTIFAHREYKNEPTTGSWPHRIKDQTLASLRREWADPLDPTKGINETTQLLGQQGPISISVQYRGLERVVKVDLTQLQYI